MNHSENPASEKINQNTTEERILEELKEKGGEITYGLTNDYMFRAVLQKNVKVLKGIIAAALELKPEEILQCEITNPIVLGESIGDKTCILDVKVKLNEAEFINLEMQMGNLQNWPSRSVYYLCSMYTDLKKGQDYNSAVPCTHIGFVSESPFPDYHEFISKYYLMDEVSGHIYSKNIALIMVDLSMADKARKEEDNVQKEAEKNRRENKELRQWARFMCARSWKEAIELSKEAEAMQEAVVTLHEMSEDEKIREQCLARILYEGDMNGARQQGLQQGLEQGLQQGLKQGLEHGMQQGKKLGRETLNQLARILEKEGRKDDIIKAMLDKDFQEMLLKKYDLWDEEEQKEIKNP